jgi:hypothetical protein
VTVQTLPTFTWNPANYPDEQIWPGPNAGNAFLTWARSQPSISGVHYVDEQNLNMDNQDQFTLGGDLTIVTPGSMSITKEPKLAAGTSSAQLSLISTSSGGVINVQSSFKPSSAISVLFYAKNQVSLGNAADFSGAVYAKSMANLSNDTIRYVPLTAVGFTGGGVLPPASSSIRNVSIREVSTS